MPSKSKEVKKAKNKYAVLIRLLEIKKDSITYKTQTSILKRIFDKGYSSYDVYVAFNYWRDAKKKSIDSFAFFLWNDCALLKEALQHTVQLPKEETKPELTNNDFRAEKEVKPKQSTLFDKLS